MGANDQVPLDEDQRPVAAKRIEERLSDTHAAADAERRLQAMREDHERAEREQARARAALLRTISPQLRSDEADLRGRHWHSTRTHIADTVATLRRELADASAQRAERAEVVAAARALADSLRHIPAAASSGADAPTALLARMLPGLLAIQRAVGQLAGAERAAAELRTARDRDDR